MSKPSTQSSGADPRQLSEPTKAIVRCCELRKRRMSQAMQLFSRQRSRAISDH